MRTTRSVGLTQAGQHFLDRVAPAYGGMAEAYEEARNLGGRPTGRLRINLMRAAVQPLFQPILAGFCEAYPDIELEIFADDGLIDLNHGGFDAGIRMGEALDADMVAVRVSQPFRFVAAATPDYIARHGRPEVPEDLRQHQCVRYRGASGSIQAWNFERHNRLFEVSVDGPIIVNDIHAMLVAVRSGVAIAYVAEPTATTMFEGGELELLLGDYAATTSGLFLYYPSRAQVMPKLRAFIDYVREYLPNTLRS